MKNISVVTLSALVLFLSACTKKPAGPTTSIGNHLGNIDTATLVDNGTSYTYTGQGIQGTMCDIHHIGGKSYFIFYIQPTAAMPDVWMTIAAIGPANGLGIYNPVPETDFSMCCAPYASQFTEYFNGANNYNVDSVMVNITKAAGYMNTLDTIEGDYEMWLSNAVGSKTVTGSIKCRNAVIND